jgi:hypothetical protein
MEFVFFQSLPNLGRLQAGVIVLQVQRTLEVRCTWDNTYQFWDGLRPWEAKEGSLTRCAAILGLNPRSSPTEHGKNLGLSSLANCH